MMKESIKKRLLDQGFPLQDVNTNKNIISLSRWTPFSCASLGIIGLLLHSPIYFLILGLLTLIGPFRPWSFYDYSYKYFFSYIIKLGVMPRHSNYRRIGCFIGSLMYLSSSLGFYYNDIYLAYIPAVAIIIIASISGFTGWCFVSTVHHLFKR